MTWAAVAAAGATIISGQMQGKNRQQVGIPPAGGPPAGQSPFALPTPSPKGGKITPVKPQQPATPGTGEGDVGEILAALPEALAIVNQLMMEDQQNVAMMPTAGGPQAGPFQFPMPQQSNIWSMLGR